MSSIYPFTTKSKGQRSRSQGHKVQKYISVESDRMAVGVSLHSIEWLLSNLSQRSSSSDVVFLALYRSFQFSSAALVVVSWYFRLTGDRANAIFCFWWCLLIFRSRYCRNCLIGHLVHRERTEDVQSLPSLTWVSVRAKFNVPLDVKLCSLIHYSRRWQSRE